MTVQPGPLASSAVPWSSCLLNKDLNGVCETQHRALTGSTGRTSTAEPAFDFFVQVQKLNDCEKHESFTSDGGTVHNQLWKIYTSLPGYHRRR